MARPDFGFEWADADEPAAVAPEVIPSRLGYQCHPNVCAGVQDVSCCQHAAHSGYLNRRFLFFNDLGGGGVVGVGPPAPRRRVPFVRRRKKVAA